MVKISNLPLLDTTDVDGSEALPVVKDGETMQTPASPLVGNLAQPYVDQAATAAAAAQNAVGQPAAASTAAGLAATAEGETFWVNAGDGTGTVYRHDAGSVATQIGRFIINMAASGAAALLGFSATDVYPDGTPGAVLQSVREKLNANRTYYVRPDGSDANNGKTNTAGGAFATLQKAIDTAYRSVDARSKVVTIQLADGTYTAGAVIQGRLTGGGFDNSAYPLQIIGNEAAPGNVVISTTAATALALRSHAHVLLAGVKIETVTSGYGWSVDTGSVLEHRNCELGSVANDTIIAQGGGIVRAIGPTTVSGASSAFCHAIKGSQISFSDQTLTFVGTPAFTTYLWGINKAFIDLANATIVGSATGGITVHMGGLLDVTGLTGSYLGGSALQVDDGGEIINSTLILNRTFYVRPDGNDSNDGLVNTAARAFKTVQAAVNAVAKRTFNPRVWGAYNPVTDNCTIQLAAGTYNETIYLRDLFGYMGCTIKGDEATPSNVVLAGIADCLVGIGIHSKWAIKGVKLTAAGGSLFRLSRSTHLTYQNVDFGTATGGYHIYLEDRAHVLATGNYTISGGAGAHILARQSSANIGPVSTTRTVTLTGAPAFTNAFIYLEDASVVRATGMTFTGAATGKRYQAAGLSLINTNAGGATYLPGDVAGSTSGGSQYV